MSKEVLELQKQMAMTMEELEKSEADCRNLQQMLKQQRKENQVLQKQLTELREQEKRELKQKEGDGQVGAVSPAMNEAKQVDVLARFPDTAQLNDLVSSHKKQKARLIVAHIGSYHAQYHCKED